MLQPKEMTRVLQVKTYKAQEQLLCPAKHPLNFPAETCKAAAELCICAPASSRSPSEGKGSEAKGIFPGR